MAISFKPPPLLLGLIGKDGNANFRQSVKQSGKATTKANFSVLAHIVRVYVLCVNLNKTRVYDAVSCF